MRNRLMRGLALGAASTMLAGGAALTVANTASAAPAPRPPAPNGQHQGNNDNDHHHCSWQNGHWSYVWHHGFWDRWGHWHHGFWVKVWFPGHWVCSHR
jgi:hypothetical protein